MDTVVILIVLLEMPVSGVSGYWKSITSEGGCDVPCGNNILENLSCSVQKYKFTGSSKQGCPLGTDTSATSFPSDPEDIKVEGKFKESFYDSNGHLYQYLYFSWRLPVSGGYETLTRFQLDIMYQGNHQYVCRKLEFSSANVTFGEYLNNLRFNYSCFGPLFDTDKPSDTLLMTVLIRSLPQPAPYIENSGNILQLYVPPRIKIVDKSAITSDQWKASPLVILKTGSGGGSSIQVAFGPLPDHINFEYFKVNLVSSIISHTVRNVTTSNTTTAFDFVCTGKYFVTVQAYPCGNERCTITRAPTDNLFIEIKQKDPGCLKTESTTTSTTELSTFSPKHQETNTVYGKDASTDATMSIANVSRSLTQNPTQPDPMLIAALPSGVLLAVVAACLVIGVKINKARRSKSPGLQHSTPENTITRFIKQQRRLREEYEQQNCGGKQPPDSQSAHNVLIIPSKDHTYHITAVEMLASVIEEECQLKVECLQNSFADMNANEGPYSLDLEYLRNQILGADYVIIVHSELAYHLYRAYQDGAIFTDYDLRKVQDTFTAFITVSERMFNHQIERDRITNKLIHVRFAYTSSVFWLPFKWPLEETFIIVRDLVKLLSKLGCSRMNVPQTAQYNHLLQNIQAMDTYIKEDVAWFTRRFIKVPFIYNNPGKGNPGFSNTVSWIPNRDNSDSSALNGTHENVFNSVMQGVPKIVHFGSDLGVRSVSRNEIRQFDNNDVTNIDAKSVGGITVHYSKV